MKNPFSLQCHNFLLISILHFYFSPSCAYTRHINFRHKARLDNNNNTYDQQNVSSPSRDFKTLYYSQTLDHFNYRPDSYATFSQKYVINFKHWGGTKSNSPILVSLGGESPLGNVSYYNCYFDSHADEFHALLLYIEHRFYGESIPFGLKFEQALKNDTIRGYFNSEQALADYAEVILHVKRRLNAKDSPVIVIGCSYAGMLAAWFRLKYPHIAIGAMAGSAPLLYFDDITPEDGYYSVISKDFRDISESCFNTIRSSWDVIDKVGSTPTGLKNLTKQFHSCTPLNNTQELKDYLESAYVRAAQYNVNPSVHDICNAIDATDNNTLQQIYNAVLAFDPRQDCRDISGVNNDPTQTDAGWEWQMCSEMVMPIRKGNNSGSMFQPEEGFSIKDNAIKCREKFHVSPRPHWITTYYGGNDVKTVLRKFGSNIVFSNGLMDPYSSAGVVEDISDSIVAIKTKKGSHCTDFGMASDKDPEWLVEQRRKEMSIMKEWINQYYADKNERKNKSN